MHGILAVGCGIISSVVIYAVKVIWLVIAFTVRWISFLVANLTILVLSMTNAELNYQFYGIDANYFAMTSIGILTEDIPQLTLQIAYAVIVSSRFQTKVSTLQIISFVFTTWRTGFGLSYKVLSKEEKPPAPTIADVVAKQSDNISTWLELSTLGVAQI